MTDTPLHRAIDSLGGQTKSTAIIGRGQSTISGYLTGSQKPPAEVCMRVEVATKGAFKAEDIRPDLADDFAKFIAIRSKRRRAAA